MSELTDMAPRDRGAEGILWLIQSEGLQAGDRLPAERVLCERLGVSRTALRRAIAQLESFHVLESRVGSGTYVCPVRVLSVFQYASSFSETVRTAGMTPSSRVLSQGVFTAGETLASKLGIDVGTSVFEMQRLRPADGCPVGIEATYVNRGKFAGIEDHDYATESLYAILAHEYGVTVAHGDERVSITWVNADEAELLDVPEAALAYFERGVEWTQDEVPIEYFKAVMLPDRYRFGSDESWGATQTKVGDRWLRT